MDRLPVDASRPVEGDVQSAYPVWRLVSSLRRSARIWIYGGLEKRLRLIAQQPLARASGIGFPVPDKQLIDTDMRCLPVRRITFLEVVP